MERKGLGWTTRNMSHRWFEQIYYDCRNAHYDFEKWVKERWNEINSILEVGCGHCVPYEHIFTEKEYAGLDISQENIDWCRENYYNPKHKYICQDFIVNDLTKKYDLVFSHAVVDHVYDINAFISACVLASKKYIYIVSYRGYFPKLEKHESKYIESNNTLYNKLSVPLIIELLKDYNCEEINCYPIKVNNPTARILNELVITAKING